MLILKGHRFRLDLSGDQRILAAKTAGVCRLVYNLGLQQRSTAYRSAEKRKVYYNAQAAELTALKEAYPWVSEVPSQCLQQSLMNLEKAFSNFFKKKADYPTYHSKYRRDSFRFPEPKHIAIDEEHQFIKLPKFGWIPYENGKGKHALKLRGEIRSVTVSRCADHWYVSVLCAHEIPDPVSNEGSKIGIDLGVAKSIMTSECEELTIRGMTKKDWRKKGVLQAQLARKVKGSNNRRKAGAKVAKFEATIACRRRDSIHKATTYLAKNHSLIVIEDLKVKNMTKSAKGTVDNPGKNVRAKSGLNRSILNVGFGEVRQQLEYKCPWYGSELRKVAPHYTSQKCSQCGYTSKENRRSQSVFLCMGCGHYENADSNAANNILTAGLAGVPGTALACGGEKKQKHSSRRSRNSAA